MNTWTPEQLDWLATRPLRIQKVAKRYPGFQCYRANDNRGHYWIYSYEEPKSLRRPVTVKLIHGRDSYLPGVAVFGVSPRTLIPCRCGHWEPPTAEQQKHTELKLSNGRDTN